MNFNRFFAGETLSVGKVQDQHFVNRGLVSVAEHPEADAVAWHRIEGFAEVLLDDRSCLWSRQADHRQGAGSSRSEGNNGVVLHGAKVQTSKG
jgi:hypothetical protein